MSVSTRVFSDIDKSKLYDIGVNAWMSGSGSNAGIRNLNRLLKQGTFVEPEKVPSDLVTMNSCVRLRIDGEKEPRLVTIVFPGEPCFEQACVSILTPMGQALLGMRVGETISWEAPEGEFTAQVEEILYQPEAAMSKS